ncbi:hypothetical protein O3G_MSEX007417 [Manduca sexta]|uniref:Uncharacterized protein n=1 Tax=Manduca sexta TaxID=7130 RepID=A0A921Z5Z8_MANSE|nr:hypothetical protein O3G_MSEX007417 [Manduca sexta]
MDSRKDSASMKNSINVDCDSEKNRNYKGSPRQASASDNSENLFTTTPSQGSSFVPVNGPRARLAHPLSNNDVGHSSAHGESSTEAFKNLPGTSQSQMYKVNSVTESEATPSSSSKASSSAYDNGTESNQDVVSCHKHKVCQDLASNSCSGPSTSGMSKTNDTAENCAFRESRKRPSTLKLNRSNLDADESSSDTGNDDYSLGSEDGCIYTYRGGEHLADLPSSFFSLDMGLPLDKHLPMPPNYPVPQQGNREQGSGASSPDMDFLEMDFDPGPSCEVDSGDESTPDADLDEGNMPEENEPVLRRASPEYMPAPRYIPMNTAHSSTSTHNEPEVYSYSLPSTSQAGVEQGDAAEAPHSYGPYIMHVNYRGEQILVRRTMSHWPHTMPVSLHVSSGDLVSPKEMLNYDEEQAEGPFAHQINQGERPTYDSANLSSALYHVTMAKKLIAENKPESESQASGDGGSESAAAPSVSGVSCVEPPRCMIWSEREACERQVTQIGTSACGATAVVNVFIALGVPVNLEKINSAVGTRQRANNAPLPRYLLSRAVAGCTAADLVSGIHKASDGLITARFFPTYPERAISLSHWLADWISLGAVPILTLNLQAGCTGTGTGAVPDAWHHQMVWGVSARGVFVCNPLACVREGAVWARLAAPSSLLVRAADVLARFTPHTDLTPLAHVPDRRFHTFNVLGQVANVIREWRVSGWPEHSPRTQHVRIPAAYQAGVTVAALTGTDAHRRLSAAPQLPLLAPHGTHAPHPPHAPHGDPA